MRRAMPNCSTKITLLDSHRVMLHLYPQILSIQLAILSFCPKITPPVMPQARPSFFHKILAPHPGKPRITPKIRLKIISPVSRTIRAGTPLQITTLVEIITNPPWAKLRMPPPH